MRMTQDEVDRHSRALDRQLKGIQANAKLAADATYCENYTEILAWLKNASSCLDEAVKISCDLRDAVISKTKGKRDE